MTSPRFSILLPTHNRADVLPLAIASALWQTERDFELLVAGDGCTDNTADVVRSFQDSRIHWFDLPKAPGIGYANRNAALKAARGHLVAYLAHDDLWFPDHLARLGAALDAPGRELAYSRCLAVGLDGTIMPYAYNLGVPGHQQAMLRGDSAITLCAVAHLRSCLDTYGYWDESLRRGGDKELWSRILRAGQFRNVAFVSEPTSLHFVADWRKTRAYAARTFAASRLIAGFVDSVLPRALRIPATASSQQHAAWEFLASDPEARVADIRAAVIQFQDAMLLRSRTPAGLFGLRIGLALATVFERVARGLLWIASRDRRRRSRNLGARMADRSAAE